MLIHIIADYGAGDLAFAGVAQRIKLHLSGAEPVLAPVMSFSTLAAGRTMNMPGRKTRVSG
jgi:hypothetical protein